MSKPFRPMLAATLDPADIDKLRYPVFVSPKLDGVRAVVKNGVVRYRSLKPIPNEHVQGLFRHLEGFDGELILGDPTDPDVFRLTSAAVRRKEGEPEVTFWVFDRFDCAGYYFVDRRRELLSNTTGTVAPLPHVVCRSPADVTQYEARVTGFGYEGIMIRDPGGPYKFGRSTLKEGYLLKLKRFAQDEAVVVGFEELMHNGNEATTDALGLTERSSHKANMVPSGTLGALIVLGINGPFEGAQFSIGSGFTPKERADIWAHRELYRGRIATYKHFLSGSHKAPRFGTFKGFRDVEDMGELG